MSQSLIVTIVYLAIVILIFAAHWKIFTKAGQPGWACIIPIYNVIVMLRVVGKPWWWLLVFLVPLVGIVYVIWMTHLLSKSFGHGGWFTLGLIFLPIIFYPILGFGAAVYKGPAGKTA